MRHGHPTHAMTPARARVLDVLRREARPLGAYDLVEHLGRDGQKRPAPMSVYRVLDYLVEHGLVHRLASKNAFLACGHGHAHVAEEATAFLICDRCGRVDETSSPALLASLSTLAGATGFHARAQVVEVSGVCARCAAS